MFTGYDIPDDLKNCCCDLYTIQLNENGCTHTNDLHEFSIIFPQGVLSPNQTITLTIGVMVYGPFLFPKNVKPVSPILWVCGNSTDVRLLQNAKVVLPHCLDIDESDDRGIKLLFLKAHVNHTTFVTKTIWYIFESVGNAVLHEGHNAALYTNHFCCICLAANVSPSVKENMQYSITLFKDIPNSRCVFAVTFLLKTCIEVSSIRTYYRIGSALLYVFIFHTQSLKKQYNESHYCDGYDFKWDGSSVLKIQYSDTPGWQLTLVKGREGVSNV